MKMRCFMLFSMVSLSTSSCVLAQDSFVIREAFQFPIISSISGVNGEGWYVREGYDDEGRRQALLVGPSGYQRDVSPFARLGRTITGITSSGDLFFADASRRKKTSILRLPLGASTPVKVGTLPALSTYSPVITNTVGETLGVTFEGSRSQVRGIRVTTLANDGGTSTQRADLGLLLSMKSLYIQLFPESDGRFTLVAGRIGTPIIKNQKAVCTGRSGSKDLACRAYTFERSWVFGASNGTVLVAGDLSASLVNASTLQMERAITNDDGSETFLTSFIEADGTLAVIAQDPLTSSVRLKRVTPAGERSSYLCPSSLGWPSVIFEDYIGSIDRGVAGFVVRGLDDASGYPTTRLYEIAAENGSADSDGKLIGRCQLEAS